MKKKISTKRKIIGSISALAAASALIAALVIPAGAQEAGTALLTYTEDEAAAPAFVLTDVSEVVKAALPSVVSITSRTSNNYNNGYYDMGGQSRGISQDDLWDYFFGDSSGGYPGYYNEVPEEYEDPQEEEIPEDADKEESADEETPKDHSNEIDYGIGSGTIIAENDAELIILTSYHVVENCSSLYVTFNNGTSIDGYIKAADEDKDISVVAVPLADIDEDTLNSISIAPIAKEEPEVGDGIIVIGNPLGYGISVTTGIVSALDREITIDGQTYSLIQTDAAINGGNSGGCMLNSKGEIVGISEAKVTRTYVEGMCYAIPVLKNIDILEELINTDNQFKDNELVDNGGFMGIQGKDVSEDAISFGMPEGVYIAGTVEGGGAEAAGLKKGDIITAVNGKDVVSMEQLAKQLARFAPGETITVTVSRANDGDYTEQDIEITLTEKMS